MALDKNLFTLNLEPSKIEPNALDLVDPSGTIHYRKRWLPNEAAAYAFSLLDPLSDSVLATATALSATSKEKVIELHNPSATVPLTFRGTLTFKWGFVWEDHQFEWKREACYMIRKPDPPVLVAVTKEPAGRIKTATVQILDYNLNRFDIEDRKGLEIVLLTSLLTFNDQSDQIRAKQGETPAASPSANVTPAASVAPGPPPLPPPKPEGWTGDQIAMLQAKEQRDVNEVVVGEAGDVEEYAKHCVSLLNDDSLLFITLRSHSAGCVSKVVQVAEATKRTRYKSGAYDEELHQYVDMAFEDATVSKGKGKTKGPPRIINLDDRPAATPAGSKTYQPPNTLTIHLSKIAMPELEPKARKGQKASAVHAKVASEPKPKPPQSASHGKQSSTEPAALVKPRPASPPPQSNGLRAKFSAFTASRSSSPPPGARPSSAPHASQSQPHSQPQLRPPSHSHSSQPRPPHASGPQSSQHLPPPHLQHAHSYPAAPHPSNMPPPRPRPQSGMYALPPGPGPFPGAGPLNAVPGNAVHPAAPGNAVYAMYPSAFGAAPIPPQPQVQRVPGMGFLDKLVRR